MECIQVLLNPLSMSIAARWKLSNLSISIYPLSWEQNNNNQLLTPICPWIDNFLCLRYRALIGIIYS